MFAYAAFTKITVDARACLASLWLLALPVTDVSAQGQGQRGNDQDVVKQQKIYRSQGEDVPRGYIVMRGLSHYAELLPAGFEQALKKLGPDDRWLDIGAGSGQAVLDYYAPGYLPPRHNSWTPGSGRARVVAVSIEDRRTKVWDRETERLTEDRVRYLFGKRLREYAKEELGTFQLITDVYGGFSYTDELSKFMEKVLGFLAVDGSFYTLLQSVKLEDARDDPSTTYYLTELVDPAGRDVKVCSWLKSIACVEVSCESHSDWDTPTELIRVRKVCDAVSVPALSRLNYEAGTPPRRGFELQ